MILTRYTSIYCLLLQYKFDCSNTKWIICTNRLGCFCTALNLAKRTAIFVPLKSIQTSPLFLERQSETLNLNDLNGPVPLGASLLCPWKQSQCSLPGANAMTQSERGKAYGPDWIAGDQGIQGKSTDSWNPAVSMKHWIQTEGTQSCNFSSVSTVSSEWNICLNMLFHL